MLGHTEVSHTAFVNLLLNNCTGHGKNRNHGIQQDALHRPDSTQHKACV